MFKFIASYLTVLCVATRMVVQAVGIRFDPDSSTVLLMPGFSGMAVTVSPPAEYQGKYHMLVASTTGKIERMVFDPATNSTDTGLGCLVDYTTINNSVTTTFAKVGSRILLVDRTDTNYQLFKIFEPGQNCAFASTNAVFGASEATNDITLATMTSDSWLSNIGGLTSKKKFRRHNFSSASGTSVISVEIDKETYPDFTTNMTDVVCLDDKRCLGITWDAISNYVYYAEFPSTTGIQPISVEKSVQRSQRRSTRELRGIDMFLACNETLCSMMRPNSETKAASFDTSIVTNGTIVAVGVASINVSASWLAIGYGNNTVQVLKLIKMGVDNVQIAVALEPAPIGGRILSVFFINGYKTLSVIFQDAASVKISYFKAEECTVPNCATCLRVAGLCTECVIPYYLDPMDTNVCIVDNFNCQVGELFDLSLGCTPTCPPGTGKNAAIGTCEMCISSLCTDCTNNASQCGACPGATFPITSGIKMGICTTCIDEPGYYKSGGTCMPCDPMCTECSNAPTNCTRCANLSPNIPSCSVTTPGPCKPDCATCNITDCLTCIPQHYLSSNSCLSCDTTCAVCSGSTSNCSSCVSGKFLYPSHTCGDCNEPNHFKNTSDGTCGLCHSSCVTCNGLTNNTCLTCEPLTKFLNYGSCLPCPVQCSQCDANGICTACAQFTMSSNCLAPPCHASCPTANCNTTDGTCTGCSPGSILLNNQCEPCDSNCSTCTGIASSCASCTVGNYLNGTQCLPCDAKCNGCNMLTGECSACTSNMYSTPTCEPVPCDPSCGQILPRCDVKTGNCLGCLAGKFLSTNSCMACDNNCSECLGSSTHCTSCKAGTYLVGNTCVPCDAKCNGCNSVTGACTACANSSLNTMAGCVDGLPCTANCLQCNTTTGTCNGCYDGFRYDSGSLDCDTCTVLDCADCELHIDSCSKCKAGKYLQSPNTCVLCSTECNGCNSVTGACTACVNSLLTPNAAGQCVLLGAACGDGVCVCNNGSVCLSCAGDGYFLDQGSCKTCTAGCRTCSGVKDNCSSCLQGYTLNNLTNKCDLAIPSLNFSNGTNSTVNSTINDSDMLDTNESKLTIVEVIYTSETDSVSIKFSEDLTTSSLDANAFKIGFFSSTTAESSKTVRRLGRKPPSDAAWGALPKLLAAPLVKTVKTSGNRIRLSIDNPGTIPEGSFALHMSKPSAIVAKSNSALVFGGFVASGTNKPFLTTKFDQTLASATQTLKATFSALTILAFLLNASQAFVLMKVCQTLDLYIYLNLDLPANFARFVDFITSTPIDLVPNFLEPLVDDDTDSDRDRFAEFGQTVNIMSNLGSFFTLAVLMAISKVLILLFNLILRKFGDKAKRLADRLDKAVGIESAHGLFESYHQDEVLSMIVIITQGYRLRHRLGNKIFITVFVSLFSLFMISMYLFMGYTVRKLTQRKKDEELLDDTAKLESDEKHTSKQSKSRCFLPISWLEKFDFLLEGKTQNGNIFQRHFNLIQLFKDIVFAALLYALYYKPLVLIILLTLMQVSYVAALFKYPPYTDKKDSRLVLVTNCIYIFMDFQFMALAAISSSHVNLRYYGLGYSLIFTVLGVMATNMGFIFYQSLQDFKMRRAKRLAQKNSIEMPISPGKAGKKAAPKGSRRLKVNRLMSFDQNDSAMHMMNPSSATLNNTISPSGRLPPQPAGTKPLAKITPKVGSGKSLVKKGLVIQNMPKDTTEASPRISGNAVKSTIRQLSSHKDGGQIIERKKVFKRKTAVPQKL